MKICPHCQKPIMSKHQSRVLELIQTQGPLTSPMLAKLLGISVTNAATTLSRFNMFGVLTRTQIKDRAGIFYVYRRVE